MTCESYRRHNAVHKQAFEFHVLQYIYRHTGTLDCDRFVCLLMFVCLLFTYGTTELLRLFVQRIVEKQIIRDMLKQFDADKKQKAMPFASSEDLIILNSVVEYTLN